MSKKDVIKILNDDGDPVCWCGKDAAIELHQMTNNTYWYCEDHWNQHQDLYRNWLMNFEVEAWKKSRGTFLYPWKGAV
jgi:hypothetical protein